MELLKEERAISRLKKCGFSELTAMAYPDASTHELKIAINWMIWLFLFDDQLDECGLGRQPDAATRIIDRLLCHATTEPRTDIAFQSPVERAFVSLWQEYAMDLSQVQQRRFMQNIRNYLSSLRWEVEFRAGHIVPSLLTFVNLRRDTGAVRLAFDLIEFGLHGEMPEIVRAGMEMGMLKSCAIDVICMSNDVFSFEKEQARGDVNNILVAWQENTKSSIQAAADAICALITERQNQFIASRRKLDVLLDSLSLPQADRDRVQRYVLGMERWMKANLEYSLTTPRYRDIEASQPGKPVSWVENICSMPDEVFFAP
jgi:hypothetical protein